MDNIRLPKGKESLEEGTAAGERSECTEGARGQMGSSPMLWDAVWRAKQAHQEANRWRVLWDLPFLGPDVRTPEIDTHCVEKLYLGKFWEPFEVIVPEQPLLLNKT